MNAETKTYLLGAGRRLWFLVLLGLIYWFGVLPVIHWTLTGQHPILESLRNYLAHNLADIISAIGAHITALMGSLALLGVGFVTVRPKVWPRNWQEWYEWIGNAVEAALPGRFRNNHDQQPNPTPPADPAQPKP